MSPSEDAAPTGPLTGVRVVELAGIGPSPLACSLLADLGADVIRVDRKQASGLGLAFVANRADVRRRGRPSVAVDLKHADGVEAVLELIDRADAVIDPFRPGVTERLGLGPDVCRARNPKLVYARMTGWGQDGPLAQAAGHDLNYIALTGVLNAIGPAERPVPPLNVVGDMGGGAMFLLLGLLAAIIEARSSGEGQVVDVAMTEGAAYLALGCFGLMADGHWSAEREDNILDGGAPFYRCYETSDGGFVSIAAIEPKFYADLLAALELDPARLPEQMDRSGWPQLHETFARCFASETRDTWCERLEGTDVCFAPVLGFAEAAAHPHAAARGSFVEVDGITQPAPAPRFSRTPGRVRHGVRPIGADTRAKLDDWGFEAGRIDALIESGAIAQNDPTDEAD